MLRFDVFGKEVGIVREEGGWRAVYVGREGKHRSAPGVTIPPWVDEPDLVEFLADLFHEAASPERPTVIPLTDSEPSEEA